jgi:hypothetical protein
MFSLLTGAAEQVNPRLASATILLFMFGLTMAPVFTTDPYLKLLPIFLLPAVAISMSGTLAFPMNVELLLLVGILTTGLVKLLTLNKNFEKALKEPSKYKFTAGLLYVMISMLYIGTWYVMGLADTGILTHYGLPSEKSPFYYLLIVAYIIAMLASITGFQVGVGKSKPKPAA